MTGGFRMENELGRGTAGAVYKGTLNDGNQVEYFANFPDDAVWRSVKMPLRNLI